MTQQQITDKIFQQIKDILEEKESGHHEPKIVTNLELFKSMPFEKYEYQKAINFLIKSGKIVYGRTLNDFYYKLK